MWARLIALKEGRWAHGIQIFLWHIGWLTCMQNVGAWQMLGYSTSEDGKEHKEIART
jgi:hypothetical protein